MDFLEETGLKTFVGKVNMDRNGPDILQEKNAEESAKADLYTGFQTFRESTENSVDPYAPIYAVLYRRTNEKAGRVQKEVSSSASVPPVRKYGRDRLGERTLPQH